MKVLLLSDVYKLGRAGDVKKVADGYGRNYLIPQRMAVLATPGALKQVEHIKARATVQRAILNKEMDAVAQRLNGAVLNFTMKASETGKLYGSVTNQMLVDALKEKLGVDVFRRQIDVQPIRTLGEFKVNIRLTVDLIPSVKVFVYREGEAITTQSEVPSEAVAPEAATPEAVVTEAVAPEAVVTEAVETDAVVPDAATQPEAESKTE
jgi:large subunit ribosomal protein L9